MIDSVICAQYINMINTHKDSHVAIANDDENILCPY